MSIVSEERLFDVLAKYNPWWQHEFRTEMPVKRAAFHEIMRWLVHPPSQRGLLVTGARQIGKTTLLKQAIEELLNQGVAGKSILYISYDNIFLKLTQMDDIINAFRKINSISASDKIYILIDEIQHMDRWSLWLKTFLDMEGGRVRLVATGSTLGISMHQEESGVGRWTTLRLATLSFYEFCLLSNRSVDIPSAIKSIKHLSVQDYHVLEHLKRQLGELESLFYEYLFRGGFPEMLRIEKLGDAQNLLREDIVSRVLKQDLTSVYGARNVLHIERLFLYLSLNPGSIVSPQNVANELELKTSSLDTYLRYLLDANLLYRLSPVKPNGLPFIRGNYKYYLADASIHNALALEDKSVLKNSAWTGSLVETVVFKHIFTWSYRAQPEFGYVRDSKTKREVDILVRFPDSRLVPFEVKYRNQLRPKDHVSLTHFIEQNKLPYGYLITRDTETLGQVINERIQCVPAHIFCYILGYLELGDAEVGK